MRQHLYSAYEVAQRYVGHKEISGDKDDPAVMAMLTLDNPWVAHDEVAWCSAFVNWVCFQLGLPRTKDLAARSWLLIGEPIPLEKAEAGFDIAVFMRGTLPQPGPEVIDAHGHVGFFAGYMQDVLVLGGNQQNSVSIARYPRQSLLGVRRLA